MFRKSTLGRQFLLSTPVVALELLFSAVGAQSPRPNAGLEDIVILRSIRLSRTSPTDFCATARTGFAEATAEDRYDFATVATDAASGRATNANGARVGALDACFSPTSDPLAFGFYAEGDISQIPFVGRGQCQTTRSDLPEAGITLYACRLDLTGLPAEYAGGQLTTNTLQSPVMLGMDSDLPGYTQPSIATIRLWKKR